MGRSIFSLNPTNSQEKELQIFDQIKKKFTNNGKFVFIGTLLQRAYQCYPEKSALICTSKSITYKELYFRSLLLSQELLKHGVKPHDRVLLYYENSPEFYIAYFAILQIGAVVVPVNIFLHKREIAHIIQDSEPAVIISSDTLKQNLEHLISENYLSTLPIVFCQSDFDWESPVPQKLDDEFSYFKIYEFDQDALCALLYTSGTTGVPKGVMLSSKNMMTNAIQCYTRFTLNGMTADERFFCVLPLFHVFAQNTCLWLPIMIGASVIVVPKIDRKLIREGLGKKPTIFLGFPALYGLLCLMKNAPLDSIEMFVSGADMLPDKIRAAFAIIYGRKICAGYGLTETSPVVAVNVENNENPTYAVGAPVVGVLCKICNIKGQELPSGQIGTLWVKGDNVMMGYYKASEATAQVLDNGWLNTGDLVSIDSQGFLAIRGRSKDIIIHKGLNIYPAEIENTLLMHPSVFKAAVIGQIEGISGQVPVAFVATRANDKKFESALRKLCAYNLAPYKIPRKFVCLKDLPMSATGKVDKKKLSQLSS